MLHILIHACIAIVVSIMVVFLPHKADARRSLSEIAAGLTIDETLELENQSSNPKEKLIGQKEEETEPRAPLLKKRRIPGTAAPAQRLPLYIYRSLGNNYNDPTPQPQPSSPVTKPETRLGEGPSPAEQAVSKEFEEIKDLEPATGEKETGEKETSEKETPKPNAGLSDEKEKAMRESISAVEKRQEKKEEATPPPATQQPNTTPVKRIGSVPAREQEADYVSILEKSMLLDVQPVPIKLPFYDENGNEVTLKQFKGKLIVLNFWATWCTPCAAEMPSLDALQEDFLDKELPVKVVALSEDFKDAATIRSFYTQNSIQHLDIYQDKKNALFRELGVISLPTTLLIDQKGNEILRMSGYVDWNNPDVKEFIRNFLRE